MLSPSDADSGVTPSAQTRRLAKSSAVAPHAQDWPTIDGFEILEELGRGGMGVVYKASQIELDRLVAVKMIRQQELTDPEFLLRFQMEAKAIAQIEHPHIVQIHSQGTIQKPGDMPSPYFILELVTGGDLRQRWNRSPQPPLLVGEMIEKLARAMHSVHEQGILHRDLKPGNVLLTPEGEPKITDFGLARFFDQQSGLPHANSPTREGVVLGTPEHMAPEQVSGENVLTPAVDVYALGIMLYEGLTGRCPFEGITDLDTLEQLRHQEPIPPSQILPAVPSDLETICLKCMEKEVEKRYATTAELAEDLNRYLNDRPILARRAGWTERARKWVRRKPALATALLMTFIAMLALVGVGVGLIYQSDLREAMAQTELQKQKAISAQAEESFQRERAERLLYGTQINLAGRAWEEGNVVRLRELLQKQIPDDPTETPDHRDLEWHYLQRSLQSEIWSTSVSGEVRAFGFTPKGDRYVLGTADGNFRIHDARTGKIIEQRKMDLPLTLSTMLSPTRQLIAALESKTGILSLVETSSGKTMASWSVPPLQYGRFCFSRDDSKLAYFNQFGSEIRLLDLRSKKQTHHFQRLGLLTWVGFNQDASLVFAADTSGNLKILDARSGKQLGVISLRENATFGTGGAQITISEGDQKIAVAHQDHTIRVFRRDGRLEHHLKETKSAILSLAFSRDGTRIAAGSSDHCIRVWDTKTGELLHYLRGHTETVHHVSFAPRGDRLLSCDQKGVIKLWDLRTDRDRLHFHVKAKEVRFSADSERIYALTRNQVVCCNLKTHQVRVVLERDQQEFLTRLVLSPDDQHFALISHRGISEGILVLYQTSGREVWEKRLKNQMFHDVDFSPDGQELATTDSRGVVQTWTLSGESKRMLNEPSILPGLFVRYTPDGRSILIASDGDEKVKKRLMLFDQKLKKVVSSVPLRSSPSRMASSRDGRLVFLSNNRQITAVDLKTGSELWNSRGHSQYVRSLVLSKSEERLITGSADGTIKIWDTLTGQEVLTLRERPGGVSTVALSPDGEWLASSSIYSEIRLRRVSPRHAEKSVK
mgnify:CR=1 FL=1